MARKLVPLDEAAKQLSLSPDELNEMRQNGEIYGYRDGASWKFKP
jgi:excisionase family DNA binding protein